MKKKWQVHLILFGMITFSVISIYWYNLKDNRDQRIFSHLSGVKLTKEYQVVLDEDTHGGFHGDGERKIILQLTNSQQKLVEDEIKNNSKWKPLPLTGINQVLAYGGVIGEVNYGYEFLKEWVPETSKGAYLTRNRDPETSKRFPRDLFPNNKYSFNFDFVLWDQSLRILYLYESDM